MLAVHLIGGHPAEGDAGQERTLDHPLSELGLGGEGHVIGDARLAAALPIGAPGVFGQVELAVDQSSSAW
jgi:hypothetical protein